MAGGRRVSDSAAFFGSGSSKKIAHAETAPTTRNAGRKSAARMALSPRQSRTDSSASAETATPAEIESCCATLVKLVALLMERCCRSAKASELRLVDFRAREKPPTSSMAKISQWGISWVKKPQAAMNAAAMNVFHT